jgi:hypothetical protein
MRFKHAPALAIGSLIAITAMLVVTASAMGTADPLKGGTTVLSFKLKVSKASGGAIKSGKKQATLTITGGSLDPTTGSGAVENGGSVTLKKGSKKAKLSAITTTFGSGGKISAKLKGKTTKLATLGTGTVGRAGFGGTVTGAQAKLTKGGAKALNKALGTSSFKKGKSFGSASTTTLPSTVGVKSYSAVTTEAVHPNPGEGCTVATPPTCPYAVKSAVNGVNPSVSNGAVLDSSNPNAPTLTFTPGNAGSMAPDCLSGKLSGSKGTLTLDRPAPAANVTQSDPVDDFANKSVNFTATSSLLGPLGQAAASDIDISTGTCVADPAAKTIKVTGATQRVNSAAAALFNATFGLSGSGCSAGNCPLAGGDIIGTTDWVINTQ